MLPSVSQSEKSLRRRSKVDAQAGGGSAGICHAMPGAASVHATFPRPRDKRDDAADALLDVPVDPGCGCGSITVLVIVLRSVLRLLPESADVRLVVERREKRERDNRRLLLILPWRDGLRDMMASGGTLRRIMYDTSNCIRRASIVVWFRA